MKKSYVLRLAVLALAALFILVSGSDLNAQQKKGKGGNKSGNEKKTEEKLSAGKETKKESGDQLKAEEKKGGYKPKQLKENAKMEWEGGTPPGWSSGNKTGWDGTGTPPGEMKKDGKQNKGLNRKYPPGSEGWNEKKKEKWGKDLDAARERIRTRAGERKGYTKEYQESAVRSIEGAAGEGVPVERAETVVNKAMESGMSGGDIEKVTRAVSYGADKNVDYDKLDSFMTKKIDSGERGDDLALSIYKEVDSGSMAKAQEKTVEKKEPWYKRVFKKK
ncbi:MAG: hypothetical protein JW746_05965 [Candidatus Krumholzibacteriota bacterium]|nr:hypothetical protein [Candidatus Krumholzibacteriota bacterium]